MCQYLMQQNEKQLERFYFISRRFELLIVSILFLKYIGEKSENRVLADERKISERAGRGGQREERRCCYLVVSQLANFQ